MAAKKKSLVEQAKELRPTRKTSKSFSEDEEALALSWVNDEVTIGQVSAVLAESEGKEKPYQAMANIFLRNALKQWIKKHVDPTELTY